jgi:hypothetical protein
MISITDVFPNVKGGKNAKEEMDFFGPVVGDSWIDVFGFLSKEAGGRIPGARG